MKRNKFGVGDSQAVTKGKVEARLRAGYLSRQDRAFHHAALLLMDALPLDSRFRAGVPYIGPDDNGPGAATGQDGAQDGAGPGDLSA